MGEYTIMLDGLDVEQFRYESEEERRAGWYRLMVACTCEVRNEKPILGMPRELTNDERDYLWIDKRFTADNPQFDEDHCQAVYRGELEDTETLCRLLDEWEASHDERGRPVPPEESVDVH